MKGIQYSTTKELYEAKKILYEGSNATKKTFIVALASLISLFLLLILGILGCADQWICEVDSTDTKHDYICKELRKAVNCKTVSGPIKAEVLLNIKNEVKASALAICPWEIAVSELRVCFTLLSIICVILGIYAIRKESKKIADLHFQSAIFFGVLLLIASYFDYISITNSIVNNYNLCNLRDEFEVEKDIKGEMMQCSYSYYYATVFMGVLSSALLVTFIFLYLYKNFPRSSAPTIYTNGKIQ